MIYYAIELQSGATGAGLVQAYTNKADASEKYHQILQAAVKSNVPKHGAFVIDENGFIVEPVKIYEHNQVQAGE